MFFSVAPAITFVDEVNKKFLIFDPWTGEESWRDEKDDDFDAFTDSYAIKPKAA